MAELGNKENRTSTSLWLRELEKVVKGVVTVTIKVTVIVKQAGAELGQAQLKLELDFTSIKICCIELIN